jgi:hypothetical protein
MRYGASGWQTVGVFTQARHLTPGTLYDITISCSPINRLRANGFPGFFSQLRSLHPTHKLFSVNVAGHEAS